MKIKCDCVDKDCPSLCVIDFDDKDCEISVGKKDGVYLKEKSIKKLIKYLEEIIKGKQMTLTTPNGTVYKIKDGKAAKVFKMIKKLNKIHKNQLASLLFQQSAKLFYKNIITKFLALNIKI